MELVKVKNHEELSVTAAKIINEQIQDKPNSVLGLATGSTPVETYQLLIKAYKDKKTNWSKVTTFNLDEYIGIDQNHPLSYRFFMKDKLFSKVNIKLENTFIPWGFGNIKVNAKNYETLIASKGGIDLQLLGIGSNGHIGFNEPGSTVESTTREVSLSNETIKSNARFFGSTDEVPRRAITMGIKTILQSKKILLLASGAKKALAIQKTFTQGPNKQTPSTFLQSHKNVVVVADKAACSLL